MAATSMLEVLDMLIVAVASGVLCEFDSAR